MSTKSGRALRRRCKTGNLKRRRQFKGTNRVKILVCAKQTLDPEAPLRFTDGALALPPDDADYFRLNPCDAQAMETALTFREAGGGEVDVVSVGPPRAARAIRRAWAMGADRGFHLLTAADEFDPLAVASWLAAWARGRAYDLILTGAMSEDAMRGVVGPALAAQLGWPCATFAVEAKASSAGDAVVVEREIEGGFRDALELRLPAVLTIQTGPRPPRYPTLTALLRANQTPLAVIDAATLPRPARRQSVARWASATKTRAGLTLTGTTAEKAERLRRILTERGLLV
jgi:electron transfer flavoprotein beta subunit